MGYPPKNDPDADERRQRLTRGPNARLLGHAVREARARRMISQEELGHRSQMHRDYIGSLERGEVNPTFVTLMRVARGLELPLSLLMRVYERRLSERREEDQRQAEDLHRTDDQRRDERHDRSQHDAHDEAPPPCS